MMLSVDLNLGWGTDMIIPAIKTLTHGDAILILVQCLLKLEYFFSQGLGWAVREKEINTLLTNRGEWFFQVIHIRAK